MDLKILLENSQQFQWPPHFQTIFKTMQNSLTAYSTCVYWENCYSSSKLDQILHTQSIVLQHDQCNQQKKDWQALVRVVLYLKGTIHLGIKFNRQSVAEATAATRLYCYVDAAFSCHSDSKSHTGYCFSLGDLGGMFYSKSFKQDNTTLSSTESENAAAVEAAKEIIWFRSLLNELGFSQLEPTIVFADNSSMITLAQDFSGNHKRVKHYLRRINFLIELIKTNVIHFTHVATENNIADILTKPLGPHQFIQLRGILLGYDRI